MSTTFLFDNKKIKIPGVYSTIKSIVKNSVSPSAYGDILIIDTGSGANYGGGAGISGELASNADAVYSFTDIDSFRDYIKGGYWWLLAEKLFRPARGVNGVSKIFYARAATTIGAEITFSPTGGGAAGGTLICQLKDEGVIGNGVESSNDVLTKGYAMTLHVGEVDPNKFIVKFWRGTYKGLAADGYPYDEVTEDKSLPLLLAKSLEFSNMDELFAWCAKDFNYNNYFVTKTSTKTGTGALTAADLILYPGNILASGGTEAYNPTDIDKVLEVVKDLDYSFILCDKYGDDAQGTENGKIFTHILTAAKFEKFMVVGGGLDNTKFTQTNGSIPIAQYYDSDRVIVVHSGAKRRSQLSGTGFRNFDSLYKSAAVLGRICGLEPQIPVTFKELDIDGELHNLTEKEKGQCLDYGVLATFYDSDLRAFVVLQGINSLQDNENLVNKDASSFSIQFKRIVAQINKEIVVKAKIDFFKTETGANRNTLSESYVKDWTIGYLRDRCATESRDNLLISYSDVVVNRDQDAYFVTYIIVPNTEITKVFFTGSVTLG